jgi:hypothetical protein
MEDISLHILDIAENSIRAGAKEIKISLEKETFSDLLKLTVQDNGSGMSEEEMKNAVNPFFTGKKLGKIGLGLPLLEEAAKMAEGSLIIKSNRKEGTEITATLRWSHIDRKPVGNISETIVALIGSYPDVEFELNLKSDTKEFKVTTKEIKKLLHGEPINSAAILIFIGKYIEENSVNIF